jgi:hypothetical protein
MIKFLSLSVFENQTNNRKAAIFFALFFPLFTILALWIDSVSFFYNYFDGRNLTNFLAITYFFSFFFSVQSYLRKLMFVMVFLSYIGELLFCKIVGMYHYRTDNIPLYVPFGHAIVYASGFILSEMAFFKTHDLKLKQIFLVLFSLLFLCVGLFLNDVFSLLFGLLFFLLLKRKKWQNVYYFIAVCVIFIEMVGTFFKCWTWVPKTFGFISAANPPMGAVFFYAGGDILLIKIVSYWKNKTDIVN